MSKPQGNELRIETKALGLGIHHAREVFEADKGNSSSADYELPGIGCAHSDHKDHVEIDVDMEELCALLFGLTSQGNNIGSLEHGSQISTVSHGCRASDVLEMRAIRV
jgi:hypothetical protein